MEFREQDFKYVLQNFSNVYIGARCTYEEAAEHMDMPSRLKTAIYRMVYGGEVTREETIASHLLRLTKKDMGYLFYSQLKLQIKVLVIEKVTDKKGMEKEAACEKIYSIEQFVEDGRLKEQVQKDKVIVQEMFFKKLHLTGLSV
ncbi:MAG: hypothetical protein NC412_00475 [Roseburia sp.]|nr:hypothetical protein [Roseburia sp.]MCM1278592.1 hypothetical protein [Robinsoniella sp.]